MMQSSFYDRFVNAHEDHTIGQRAFQKLKPFFVKKCKDRNVCCCKYHVELDMLREGLNAMRNAKKGVHAFLSCTCNCPVCVSPSESTSCTADSTYKGVTMLWEQVVCPKEDSAEFHKLQCLMGSCSECGTESFQICPQELSNTTWTLRWKCFENEVVGFDDNGDPRKKIREVFKETTCAEFI